MRYKVSRSAAALSFLIGFFLTFGAQFTPCVRAAEPVTQEIDQPRLSHIDCYGDPLPINALVRFGTLRMRLNEQVQGVVLSPDGTLIAAGRKVWETATGKMVLGTPDEITPPQAAADEPPGKPWRDNSRPRLNLRGAVAVAFSADGKVLLAVEPNTASIFHFNWSFAKQAWGCRKP